MKISLIMATVDRCKEIDRLIDSLERQTSTAFELIIVDQNPDTRLAPVLQRLSSSSAISHKHIVTDQKGLSVARNIAFPHVSNEIVGYPDDDCWYEDGVVDKIITYFENNPDADCVIGRWCEMDVDFEEEFHLNPCRWRQFRMGISAFSSCLFFRRGLVEKVGGFDERLGVPLWFNSGEETDLVLRCLDAGASLRYVPNIRIHHPVKSILEGTLDEVLKRVRMRSRGTGALYRKHRLTYFVIFRGLMAPLVKSFLPPYSAKRLLVNFTIMLGRLEGLMCWENTPSDRFSCQSQVKKPDPVWTSVSRGKGLKQEDACITKHKKKL